MFTLSSDSDADAAVALIFAGSPRMVDLGDAQLGRLARRLDHPNVLALLKNHLLGACFAFSWICSMNVLMVRTPGRCPQRQPGCLFRHECLGADEGRVVPRADHYNPGSGTFRGFSA